MRSFAWLIGTSTLAPVAVVAPAEVDIVALTASPVTPPGCLLRGIRSLRVHSEPSAACTVAVPVLYYAYILYSYTHTTTAVYTVELYSSGAADINIIHEKAQSAGI